MSVHPRLRTRWCLTPILAGLAALGMAVVPGTALAHSGSSPVIGHVYTDGTPVRTPSPSSTATPTAR